MVAILDLTRESHPGHGQWWGACVLGSHGSRDRTQGKQTKELRSNVKLLVHRHRSPPIITLYGCSVSPKGERPVASKMFLLMDPHCRKLTTLEGLKINAQPPLFSAHSHPASDIRGVGRQCQSGKSGLSAQRG